ncbi:MAG: MazG family protein [Desulfuromonadales bacterium]|nr:MazG family protein [Desulfuromonadales bacterium]
MTPEDTRNSVDSLLKIMQELRAPDGCPWDAEQTPESLASYILEEACELIEAIEEGAPELILDELGDLLLQVVFQAQIFSERKQFDFYDVTTGIAEKLVRRHPHVFNRDGSKTVATELDKQWDEIKRSETTHNKTCLADHLPSMLPALQRAQKLVVKATRSDRQNKLPAVDEKLLQRIIGSKNGSDCNQLDEETLGQALFHLVRLAHDANLDAEAALRKLTQKTIQEIDRKLVGFNETEQEIAVLRSGSEGFGDTRNFAEK